VTGDAPLIELRHVSKRFGAKVALRDVSVAMVAGEAVAILGGNGAGKTTLLRTMATLARPTRGAVVAFGVDPWSARTSVRTRIGVVAHQPYVYPELTCRENLRFFATMFGLNDGASRIDATLGRLGLQARADDRAGTLSRGLQQRLNLARAVLHDPAVLILDEPDTGLDAPGREVLTEIVASQVERGGAVALSTHALELALRTATRVVVVTAGRVELDAPRPAVDLQQLAALIGADSMAVGT
jgi:heme exporter protein A